MSNFETRLMMKAFPQTIRRIFNCQPVFSAAPCALLLVLALAVPCTSRAADAARTFATPEEAVSALEVGVKTHDRHALRSIFGAATEEIANPDRVQATNEFTAFAAALEEKHQLVRESDAKYVLEVGANSWPFPIPIVKRGDRWFFDTEAGKQEIWNRRIGKNELMVLKVMRGYVDAQREYASRDHDGDGVLEYAQKISSSPGQTDGLYWPTELNGEVSPLGPFVARAQEKGYFGGDPGAEAGSVPFCGYFFKILTRQGKHAPGGKYDYIINGNMIGGFALVAWPAEYGESGIMTFIVNQQGRVYQRDLGPNTSRRAASIKAYDPDSGWRVSPD